MTGSPLLRLALVLAGLALLAIPALRLAGREPAPAPAVEVHATKTGISRTIRLTFTSPLPPAEIIVSALGAEVAKLQPATASAAADVTVDLPPEGIDLVIKATWPEGAKTNALRVQAEVNTDSLADATLWGDPNVEDVVTLSGAPHP